MKNLLIQNNKRGFTPTPFNKKGVSSDVGSERGFTLVETLVALSIFSVSILGLMIVLSQGISDTSYVKRKNTATYLAQEGIEYIRNMRDTYVLYDSSSPSAGWTKFKNRATSASCDQINGCYFDDQNLDYGDQLQPIINIDLYACGASCNILRYNPLTSQYNYAVGSASDFIRKIQIVPQINSDEVKVFSTVYWTQGSGTHQITFSESLFNWIE